MVNVLLKDKSDRIIRGPYFPAAEFLDYEEQAAAFEDVIGTRRAGDALDERVARRAHVIAS